MQPNQPPRNTPPSGYPPQPQGYGPAPYPPAQNPQQPPQGYAPPHNTPGYTPPTPGYSTPPPNYQPQWNNPAQNYSPMPGPTLSKQPIDDKPKDASAYIAAYQNSGDEYSRYEQEALGTTPPVDNQYSIDYLNQLAGTTATPQVKTLNKFVVFGAIGGVLLVLALILFMILSGGKSTGTNVSIEKRLFTTYADMQNITKDARKKIDSSDLRAINGDLNSALGNSMAQITPAIESQGLTDSELKSAARKPPFHDEKLVTKLEEAKLNVRYDQVYSREMYYKVNKILIHMESANKLEGHAALKDYVKKDRANYESLQKRLKTAAEEEGEAIVEVLGNEKPKGEDEE